MRRLLNFVAACLILLAAVPAFAQSQATTAEINGRVTDAQGGVLPGATVTVTSSDTGYTRSVVTNAEGLYAIPLLPPGNYDLVSELTGFAPTRRSLVLNVGATQTINAQLQVGGVQETVTVAAGSPLVETSATVRTTTVDLEAIANLPINGRRFQDFISATPTVQVDPSRGQLSFAGQRGINSNISVDGADFNQPFFGGIRGGERSNNAFTVPQESIQEFQVVAAGYSAEFGRSTGGLVNAITKSGSNRLKGSAFYVNRNRDWAEDNAFGQSAAPTQQQFGGSIGGPIRKDKIFFFGAYEQQEFENSRLVLFDRLAGVHAGADQPGSVQLFQVARRAVRGDQRRDHDVGPRRLPDRRRRPPQRPLQLQQQQGAQRQRHWQRAGPEHHQRADQQRHREGPHEYRRGPVHQRAQPAACSSRRAASTATKSGRAKPTFEGTSVEASSATTAPSRSCPTSSSTAARSWRPT